MNALLGLALMVLAGLAAVRTTAGLTGDRLSRALAAATLFFAIFLGAFLVQGFIELLAGRPIIGLPLAVTFAALCLIATTFRARSTDRRIDRSPDRATARRWRPIPLIVAASVTLVFVGCGALLLVGFPRGYEVRAYHLPLAIRVLRDGTLHLWDQSFMHAYPVNMSVWAGFFLYLVPERFVSIVNFPFLALLAAAVFGLCRVVGGDRSAALLVAAGVATIPIIGFSALEIGADVAGVAFVAVATYMIIVRPGKGTAFLWVAGLAAGMAYGFKSLHLVPIAALGLLVLFECFVDLKARVAAGRGSVGAFVPVLIFSASALAMMSFWLIRNAIEAGNPLYPVHVRGLFDLFGWKAAPDFDLQARTGTEGEWVDASWKWALYPWVEGNDVNQNFKHSSGLGAFFAATVPVAVLVWPLYLIGTWRPRRVAMRAAGHGTAHAAGNPAMPLSVHTDAPAATLRAQAVVYGLAMIVVAAWCVLGDRQPRYVMTSIVLLAPIAAWLVTQATGRLRTGYEALLMVCVATMALVIGVRMVATNGVTLLQDPGATRKDWLEYPAAIDHLPPGSVIANGVEREVNYLLLGEGMRNRVIDVAEINRRFATADSTLRFTKQATVAAGLTHVYVMADRKLTTDDCVALKEVDRLDRNPFNHQPFEAAHILYRIDVTCAKAPK